MNAYTPRKRWSDRPAPLKPGARFGPYEAEPDRVMALDPAHPAARDGRTLFPSTVNSVAASPRLLVSGANNPKLGGRVSQGHRTGWPLYHLTLQERASCPRTCANWLHCYGDAMHMARRHDHEDPALIPALEAELSALQAAHPRGFVVRLHTLGDFFSVDYVRAWGRFLGQFPALHVFGYTARRLTDEDPESRAIAQALMQMAADDWDRWAIRTSHVEPGPMRAIVVEREPSDPAVLLCPAQDHKTASCATCGLCWSRTVAHKTIAFKKHGRKRRGS